MAFLRRQMLPAGLLSVAVVGVVWPEPGRAMGRWPTQYAAVSLIFLCSGLLLRTDDIRQALSTWRATAWGILAILFVTPAVGAWLAFRVPVEPAFQLGLALFLCMPTTLSSGIALTNQARGNAALALLLTVSTNLLGILTIPFVLMAVFGAMGNVELSATDLLLKLCLSILLPLGIGYGLRRRLAGWAGRHRSLITTVSNLALISVPWMKFSDSSERLAAVAPASLLVVVAAGLGIHAVYLTLNSAATRLLRLPLTARKAVVIMASQKTLPVALTVLAVVPDSVLSPVAKGLMAIPAITSHMGQIITDAVVATRWRGRAAPEPVAEGPPARPKDDWV